MLQIKWILLSLILAILSACTSFPRIYSGEEIHGWVIDSKTKQAIKDVVVVEIWELEGGLHTDHTANIHIAETVTDEKGYYSFFSWGPRLTVDGSMSASSPRLVFYKFGYDWVGRANTISGNLNPDNSVSEHTGKKIELEKFEGTEKQYPKKLDSVYGFLNLSSYRKSFKCMWKKVPIFTSEMIKAKRYFKERGIYSNFPHLGSLSAPECRNPKEILKDYLL